MTEVVQFKYNKGFAYISGTALLVLFFIFLFRTFQFDDKENIRIMCYFDFGLFLMLIYFILKVLAPAIKGQIALELNNDEIVDIVSKRTVRWDNVQNIRQVNFKNSSGIAIDLVDKEEFTIDKSFMQKVRCFLANSFYNTPMIIALQYISGSNSEILQIMKDYFARRKKCS
jgi:hypothetical protein